MLFIRGVRDIFSLMKRRSLLNRPLLEFRRQFLVVLLRVRNNLHRGVGGSAFFMWTEMLYRYLLDGPHCSRVVGECVAKRGGVDEIGIDFKARIRRVRRQWTGVVWGNIELEGQVFELLELLLKFLNSKLLFTTCWEFIRFHHLNFLSLTLKSLINLV